MTAFDSLTAFESQIAAFYNAPYAVAVDCCTHGLELVLRHTKTESIKVPKHTYLSVAMLADKLNIELKWDNNKWEDYYYIAPNIIDSAVYWKENSYIENTFMVLSFQFRKHLSLGRGGMILTDNAESARVLKLMSYDGRDNSLGPWAEQDIETIGYHYYMTPEIAQEGLCKFNDAICTTPKKWSYKNYPDISKLKVFSHATV